MTKIALTLNFASIAALTRFTSSIDADLLGADDVEIAGVYAESPIATDTPAGDLIDKDGFRYDPELHVSPPGLTDKGLWKVRKGKADADKAARAAFKAGGAGLVNPTLAPAPAAPAAPVAAPAPVAPAAPAMPTMPAAPAPVVAPDYAVIVNKCIGMVNSGALSMDKLGEIYGKIGVTDPNVIGTNPALQVALWTELCNIQPEG